MSNLCVSRLILICLFSLSLLINIVTAQDSTSPPPPSNLVVDDCPDSKFLTIPAEKQKAVSWCWATTAKIVMHYRGEMHEQCFVVDAVRQNQLGIYYPSTCCIAAPDMTVGCGDVFYFSYAALDEFSFKYDTLGDSTFHWSTLREQICQDKPVIYGEDYKGGGGHEYVLSGFIEDQSINEKTVVLFDPLDDPSEYKEQDYDTWLRLQLGDDEIRSYVEFLVNVRK